MFYNDLLAEGKLREGEGEERSINAYAGARARARGKFAFSEKENIFIIFTALSERLLFG